MEEKPYTLDDLSHAERPKSKPMATPTSGRGFGSPWSSAILQPENRSNAPGHRS